MGGLCGPEDGGFAGLPHIRSLRLSGQQQRVRVSVGRVVDDIAHKGGHGGEEQGRVEVPAPQQPRNGIVELLEETRHVGEGERGERSMFEASSRARRRRVGTS
jgi:hypothetical protein